MGDVLAHLGNAASAQAEYRRALDLTMAQLKVNPKDSDAMSLRALVEARLGRRAEARAHAVQAVQLAPTQPDPLFFAAMVHALTGDPRTALDQLRAAIEHGYSPAMARFEESLFSLRSFPEYTALVNPAPANTAATTPPGR
jgi:Flp pilus assembly protein TadD